MEADKAILTDASTDAMTPAMALDSALLTEESMTCWRIRD